MAPSGSDVAPSRRLTVFRQIRTRTRLRNSKTARRHPQEDFPRSTSPLWYGDLVRGTDQATPCPYVLICAYAILETSHCMPQDSHHMVRRARGCGDLVLRRSRLVAATVLLYIWFACPQPERMYVVYSRGLSRCKMVRARCTACEPIAGVADMPPHQLDPPSSSVSQASASHRHDGNPRASVLK